MVVAVPGSFFLESGIPNQPRYEKNNCGSACLGKAQSRMRGRWTFSLVRAGTFDKTII